MEQIAAAAAAAAPYAGVPSGPLGDGDFEESGEAGGSFGPQQPVDAIPESVVGSEEGPWEGKAE